MVKTVQVEEKRCICDICCAQYFVIHDPFDEMRYGWIRVTNFANTGKNLDICPSCAEFLKSSLDDKSEETDG